MESSSRKPLEDAAVVNETGCGTTTIAASNSSSEISELGAEIAVSNNDGEIQAAQEDGYCPATSDTGKKTEEEEEVEKDASYSGSDTGSEEEQYNINEATSTSSNCTASSTISSIDSSALKRMGVRQLKPSYKNNSYHHQPLFFYPPFFMPMNYAAALSMPEPEQVKSSTNLYIRGLVEDFTDEDLVDMCKQYGPIKSTKSILDKKTGCCKGYGFVDFQRPEDAQRGLAALLANGVVAEFANLQEQDPTNLYISNLPKMFNEKHLQNLVSPYGNIVSSRILREPNGYSRGVGFVRLDSREDCLKAIEKLHDRPIPGSAEPLAVKLADSGNYKKNKINSFQGWANGSFLGQANLYDMYLQQFANTAPNFSGDPPVFPQYQESTPATVHPHHLVPSNNVSPGKSVWHGNGLVHAGTNNTMHQLQQYVVHSFPGYNQVQGTNLGCIPPYYYPSAGNHVATAAKSSSMDVHGAHGTTVGASAPTTSTAAPPPPPYHHHHHQYNTAAYPPSAPPGLAPPGSAGGISAGPHHTAHFTSQYPQGWTITPNHHHYPNSQHP